MPCYFARHFSHYHKPCGFIWNGDETQTRTQRHTIYVWHCFVARNTKLKNEEWVKEEENESNCDRFAYATLIIDDITFLMYFFLESTSGNIGAHNNFVVCKCITAAAFSLIFISRLSHRPSHCTLGSFVFDISRWEGINSWVLKWLRCVLGFNATELIATKLTNYPIFRLNRLNITWIQ